MSVRGLLLILSQGMVVDFKGVKYFGYKGVTG